VTRADARASSDRGTAAGRVPLVAANWKMHLVRRDVEDFARTTGWQPGATASFAGALRYSLYNPLIRLLMRLIVGMAGGETDTSRDYEYTDWAAVERFARQIFARIATGAAA